MTPRSPALPKPAPSVDLYAVDAAMQSALAAGAAGELPVIGFGEISTVIAWPTTGGDQAAIKSLPVFASPERYARFAAVVTRYVSALTAAGITVVATELRMLERAGRAHGYIVQPLLDAENLAVGRVRDDDALAATTLRQIVEHVLSVVSPSVGFDAQLSNWVLDGDELVYLDIGQPMLRAEGVDEIDLPVFCSAYPAVLRPALARFVFPRVLAQYHDPRTVLVDLAANLIKERLEHLIPIVTDAADGHVPPISDQDVRAYYASDARTWSLIQRLRRADRTWQRSVRRRPYPFLLPEVFQR